MRRRVVEGGRPSSAPRRRGGRNELAEATSHPGRAARARLAGLVGTTRFAALPPTIRCSGALPDFASTFVTVRRAGTADTVLVHGDCSRGFATLYDALARAVGIPA